jgi:SsrA-binding protein
VAGLQLLGSEIKSIRDGKANLIDAFCAFEHGELWVRNLHIAEYTWANRMNHETKRARKLLLKKGELRKLEAKVKEKGFTIVPVKLFLSERGFAKLEIALARGKKTHDKRSTIRERDVARDMDREKARFKR